MHLSLSFIYQSFVKLLTFINKDYDPEPSKIHILRPNFTNTKILIFNLRSKISSHINSITNVWSCKTLYRLVVKSSLQSCATLGRSIT
jgi:hypothetical protein